MSTDYFKQMYLGQQQAFNPWHPSQSIFNKAAPSSSTRSL